jgi:P pilus assembly chaperone PapD
MNGSLIRKWRRPPARSAWGLCLFVILLLAGAAPAQTVRPLLSEYEGEADGSFELVNDSFVPLSIVIEPQSFTVDEDGNISYRPLDKHIHLKLSAMSFKIPPKQSHTVHYRASADTKPAWFVIYSYFRGLPVRTESGMAVQISLPHTVYVLPKKAATKHDLNVRRAEYQRDKQAIVIEVENRSDLFARVLMSEASGAGKKEHGPGFPIYPHSYRRIEIPWTHGVTPEKVLLRLRRFSLEAQTQSGNSD